MPDMLDDIYQSMVRSMTEPEEYHDIILGDMQCEYDRCLTADWGQIPTCVSISKQFEVTTYDGRGNVWVSYFLPLLFWSKDPTATRDWAGEHCTDWWMVKPRSIAFRSIKDAVLYRLSFPTTTKIGRIDLLQWKHRLCEQGRLDNGR